MNTYSEKLKDPRWQDFRKKAFFHYGDHCSNCGENENSGHHHHIHHKRYYKDREPWQYEMEDVTVLCRKCHDSIHDAENHWRDIIRRSPRHYSYHFKDLAVLIDHLDDDRIVAVLAKAKVRAEELLKILK